MWHDEDWIKFYDVGNHLSEFSGEEEYLRSASGRYYYSCFGVLRLYYHKTTKKYLPSYKGHSTLINFLENSNYDEEKYIGKKLRKLRDLRVKADYKSNFKNQYAFQSKDLAEDIIELTNCLFENPLYSDF